MKEKKYVCSLCGKRMISGNYTGGWAHWNSEDLKKCMKLWKEETGIQDDDQAYFRERLPIEISEYPSLKPQEYPCRQVMVWKK